MYFSSLHARLNHFKQVPNHIGMWFGRIGSETILVHLHEIGFIVNRFVKCLKQYVYSYWMYAYDYLTKLRASFHPGVHVCTVCMCTCMYIIILCIHAFVIPQLHILINDRQVDCSTCCATPITTSELLHVQVPALYVTGCSIPWEMQVKWYSTCI